jgi:hypothetical protein
MDYWLTKAIECLPELEDIVTEPEPQRITGPMSLWIEIYLKLIDAYDVVPINEDLIRRIYDFADWCLKQPSTSEVETDVSTAVSVAFIEDLPLDERITEDLHRWVSIETFKGFENLFRYHLSDEEYQRFEKDFLNSRRPTDPPPRL